MEDQRLIKEVSYLERMVGQKRLEMKILNEAIDKIKIELAAKQPRHSVHLKPTLHSEVMVVNNMGERKVVSVNENWYEQVFEYNYILWSEIPF